MTGNNFNVWQESFIESFLEINSQSNIKSDWLNYSEILKTEYKDCIIKPINMSDYFATVSKLADIKFKSLKSEKNIFVKKTRQS